MEVNGLTLLADAVVFAFVCLALCFLVEHWRDRA